MDLGQTQFDKYTPLLHYIDHIMVWMMQGVEGANKDKKKRS